MRFVLYTDKTVPQCLTAINARMQVKGTSTRPALDGWVEKGGAFAISLTTAVIGKFTRRTTLKAQVERDGGITIIRGSVPSGAPREGQAFVFIALVLVALTIIGSGNVLIGLLLIPVAAYLYIPLRGDYQNSDVLIDEVQKTLKAKPNPPKSLTDAKAAKPSPPRQASAGAPHAAPAKSSAAKPSSPRQPSGGARPSKDGTRAAPAKPTAARSAASAKRATAAKPSAETEPAAPPASEFPLLPDEAEAPASKPTPNPPRSRPAASKPPAEKEPPPPPASEFPEVPGEAPP